MSRKTWVGIVLGKCAGCTQGMAVGQSRANPLSPQMFLTTIKRMAAIYFEV
jgi:hypothetical protein